MVSQVVKTYPITVAGATIAIPVTDQYTLYVFTGSGVLAGNITIAESGTPQYGVTVNMLWLANFTLGVQVVSVFGETLTTVQVTKNLKIVATYNGSSWTTIIEGLFGETGVIETANIADDAVTLAKMADIARGSLIVGGVANAPTALDAKTSGQILVGDGTSLVSVAVSGDVTLSSAGAVAIAAGVIVNADVNASAAIAYSKLAALPSAEILVGSAGNVATAVAVTGDVTISNAGVTAIAAGAIVNADVAAGAAIAFSKLAALTGGNVILGSAGTVPTSTAISGAITLSNTGVATLASGIVAVSNLATAAKKVQQTIDISFESGYQSSNQMRMSYAGTIDFLFSSVGKALAGTDNGTIIPRINGVAVTNGTVTIALSAALNEQDTATPSALNTFAIDDVIDFLAAKTTAGGLTKLTVWFTRT